MKRRAQEAVPCEMRGLNTLVWICMNSYFSPTGEESLMSTPLRLC